MATVNGIIQWGVVFGGFTQRKGRLTGSFKCWQKLEVEMTGPNRRTEFRAWNDDPCDLADLIFHASAEGLEPAINVAGYSWGGAAAVRFAKCCQARGLLIDRMTLCDPVYRHAYWAGNWRAFVPWSRLIIPANVRRVDWLRQAVNYPRGHNLVAAPNSATIINDPIELDRRHEWMDDAPEYHTLAVEAARGVL